jgi:hypothetical protein
MIHWRASSEKPRSACAEGSRDIHDRYVENDHQLGDGDDAEDQPAAIVMVVLGGGHGVLLGGSRERAGSVLADRTRRD